MIRLTRSKVQPIGLDIGSDSIKMVQVETVGQTLSVIASARQSVPPPASDGLQGRLTEVADVVKQMFRHGRFAGRGVVVALPREMLHVKNLRMPLIPQHELAAAVKFEARNIFPFETEKAHIQILPAGEVRQGIDVRQEVIVLAARHEDVNGFVEQLHRCGARVESIDVEAAALYRSQERFIRRREDEQDVHVLVDIGCRRSQVVIGRGREISFIKGIEIGSHQFHEAISRKLGITMDEARGLRRRLIEAAPGPAGSELLKKDAVRQAVFDATRSTMEELGREVGLCLRYYSVTFRGQRPSRLRLFGGEAADPMLLGVLNAGLSIPVESGRPLFSVDTSRLEANERVGFMSEWAQAFGLSLKLTAGPFAPRDGKPRDPSTPAGPPAAAEVVDIAKAIENSTPIDVIRRTELTAGNDLDGIIERANHPKRRAPMREIDFLPEWYPKVRQRRRLVACQAWVTLILVCGLGIWLLLAQRNVHARDIELAALRNDLDQSETELDRLEDLLQLQRQLGQQDQIFMKIGRPIEATRLITTLEQMMPGDMALLDLTVETLDVPRLPPSAAATLAARATPQNRPSEARLRFRMHGVAPTDVDLADFLARLTSRPFFTNVELMYSHERQDRGYVMREFEVTFSMELPGSNSTFAGGR